VKKINGSLHWTVVWMLLTTILLTVVIACSDDGAEQSRSTIEENMEEPIEESMSFYEDRNAYIEAIAQNAFGNRVDIRNIAYTEGVSDNIGIGVDYGDSVMTAHLIREAIAEVLEELSAHNELADYSVSFHINADGVLPTGEVNSVRVLDARFEAETLQSINWDNFRAVNIPAIADEFTPRQFMIDAF